MHYAHALMEGTRYALAVGEAIAAAMAMRRVAQSELARASGVPQSTLSHYVNGTQAKPAAETLLRLARALRVPVDYLVDPAPTYAASARRIVELDAVTPPGTDPAEFDEARRLAAATPPPRPASRPTGEPGRR